MQTTKKILGKINTQRCSVTLKEYNWIFYSDKLPIFFLILTADTRVSGGQDPRVSQARQVQGASM